MAYRERKKCDQNQTRLPSLTFSLAFLLFIYRFICHFLFCAAGPDWIWLLLLLVAVILLLSFTTRAYIQTQSYSCYRHIFPTESAENAGLTLPNQQSGGKMTSGDTRFIRTTAKDIANGHRLRVYICEWFWGCHTIKHTEEGWGGGSFRTILPFAGIIYRIQRHRGLCKAKVYGL